MASVQTCKILQQVVLCFDDAARELAMILLYNLKGIFKGI